MRNPVHVFFVAWCTLQLGCGGAAPPPPTEPASPTAKAAEPQSAEWLFVTDGVAGGRKGECAAVAAHVVEEASCKAALCAHGAALARDWLRVCKDIAPSQAAELEKQAEVLDKKSVVMAAPCEEQVRGVLRNGCGERESCTEFVQSWATRCAEWSTPLVVRMLEVAAERQSGERVKIDARSCTDLLGEVEKHALCEQQFVCQDALPSIDTFKSRCQAKGKLPSLQAAVTQLSIRVGATEKPEPMPIASSDEKLDPKSPLTSLEDGSGAVLMVCGKRTRDIKAYLEARKTCDGEVVFARRFIGDSGPVVRVGSVAHPDDAGFHLRFPSLALAGEHHARYEASLVTFAKALDEAAMLVVQSGKDERAIRTLVGVVNANLDEIRNSADYEKALVARDTALVPLFRAVGAAKRKGFHLDLEERKLAPALRRAQKYLLADIGMDGRVKVGGSTPAGSITWDDMLPKAMAAYREALEPRLKLLPRMKAQQRELDRLSLVADGAASRCGQAIKTYEESERALLDCAFGVQQCDDARVLKLNAALDLARGAAETGYPETVLAIGSLVEEQRVGAWTAAKLAGCREPWW